MVGMGQREPSDHVVHDFLLKNTRWVQRLVWGMTTDEHLAEDVAQEVCLSALTRGPRNTTNLHAWFRNLARYVLFKVRRSERRRLAREHRHGITQAEANGNGHDDARRSTTGRRVAQAVLSLPEPYRSTVLLRYYENLPPREIARRHHVSVETVRTRLRRARERLRPKLLGEWRARRWTWFVPFLLPRILPRAALPKVAAAAVLLAGPLFIALYLEVAAFREDSLAPRPVRMAERPDARPPDGAIRGGPPAATRKPVRAAGPAPTPLPGPAPDDAAPRTPPGASTAAAPQGVHGVVRDERGDPLQGALVGASEPFDPLAARTTPALTMLKPREATRTNANGEFSLPLLDGLFLVVAKCPGRAYDQRLATGNARLDFTLHRPGRLTGRVRHADSSLPVPRAVVALVAPGSGVNVMGFAANGTPRVEATRFAHATGRTDETGRFVIDRLAPGTYQVSLHAPGNAVPNRGEVVVRADAETTLDFEISPPARNRLTGRVIDRASGQPIAGAGIFSGSDLQHRAWTDEDGRYACAGVFGECIRVHAAAKGYLPESVDLTCTRGRPMIHDFSLVRPGRVSGRVIDAFGRPVSGAAVASHPSRLAPGSHGRRTVTDPDGRFRLDPVRPGSRSRLFAVAPGYAPAASPPFVLAPAGSRDGVVIRLDRGGSIHGRLLFLGARPAPTRIHRRGVSLHSVPVALKAVGDGASDRSPADLLGHRESRADGGFTFETVPAGDYRVAAWIGGSYHVFPDRVRVKEGVAGSVRLVIDPVRSIAGRVVDAAGAPLQDVRVEVQGLPDTTRTDREGRFELHALPGARHRIVARHVRCPRPAVLDDVAVGRRDVVIRMQRSSLLSGRVFLASTGRPVSSFWIRVIARSDAGLRTVSRHAFVDPEGRFELPLPGGGLAVEARTDEGLGSRRVALARPLQPGERGPVVDLYLEAGRCGGDGDGSTNRTVR